MNDNINNASFNSLKTMTRLAAVQASYRKSFDEADSSEILEELDTLIFSEISKDSSEINIDKEFYSHILDELNKKKIEIDDLLSSVLINYSLERLEIILSSILRLATCEFIVFVNVPARVIIDEYVGLAHAFFDGEQPNLANGILDNLAKKLRPEEFKLE